MTETAEPPPGCLVLLIRLSADMTADVVTGRGESTAFASARMLADELLEGLVNTVAGGYAVGEIDVAVLGYRAGEDGSPQLLSLLPNGDAKPRLVPLVQIAEMPAEARAAEGQPRKWAVLPSCEGEPCAGDALASAYQMVAMWLTGRFTARPPVVIHCTTPTGLDDAYFRVARSLGLLATGYGPVRLLHYLFDNQAEAGPLAACWDRLYEVSAEVPENADAGAAARCGVWVNEWDISDPWNAIFTYAWRGDTIAWSEAGAGFNRSRAMWTQKMGNTPEQWEDAYASDPKRGTAAVADGASTGIYCRTWADQLSKRFVADRPDTRDPVALNKWVNTLRTEWRAAIDYGNLNWSKKAKVDQVGAAATLLGLELGPADDGGNRPWRACAVGDACLFWLRGGELLASFPVVAADQFGSAPLLVRSSPGYKTLAVAAAGRCRPGDRFILATDAVAARLFKSTAIGPGPEWSGFETISQAEWRADLDRLRRSNDMVNDDCTLVVLRVTGGAEEPEWVSEETGEQGASAPCSEEKDQKTEECEPSAAVASEVQTLPVEQGVDAPRSPEEVADAPDAPDAPDESPNTDLIEPVDEPPAARDGFPESTDTRD